jgi:hypothetical protein
MATLHFPLWQHLGKLNWNKEEEKLNSEAIENATHILYYLGYNASEALDCNGIKFSMRQIGEINYRNILFDFVLLFQWFDIKLPDLDYAKVFLKDLYTPLEVNNVISKSKIIVHNDTLQLVQTVNYMVNGEGYNIPNLEKYINQYNDGEEILPIIATDKITDLMLKIKIDCAQGTFLNDPFSNSII